MNRFDEVQLPPMAEQTQPATDRQVADAAGQAKLWIVPAAWPAGVSALALAVNACQRRDIYVDLPLRTPKIVPPPAFCD